MNMLKFVEVLALGLIQQGGISNNLSGLLDL